MSEAESQTAGDELKFPPPTFQLLAAQFATQAMMELGEVQNPITGKSEVSLPRAKFTIDMLQIIKDKTQGNLSPEELQYLDGALYELRMRFMQKQKGDEASEG